MNTILSRKTLFALLILIVVAVLIGLISPREVPKKETTNTPENVTPFQVTVIGKVVCLPHKDTTGPVTAECAYGLQTPDGAYYALDLTQAGDISNIMTDNSVIIDGMYTPISMISSDHWQTYDIGGIIQVSSVSTVGTSN